VIVPDINLLVFAYNSDAPHHEAARRWWEACLSGEQTVGIPWTVVLGFVRVMTSRAVATDPMTPVEALGHARAWMERPQARPLVPGPRHLEILSEIMGAADATGRLTTDAHLAALAIETQAELNSNDADFARFPGLRWRNPVAG
jgi:toxin-antitoxin system PIN domain toxin